MNSTASSAGSRKRWFSGPTEGRAQLFIRLAVGLIFATQGLLKFIDPHLGALRFARIGFPWPEFTARFVGTFEVGCGVLVLVGLWTRIACLPLLAVILTAIATTKIPELARPGQGFWFMVSDARTDFAMLMSLCFLVGAGGGRWSVEAKLPGAATAAAEAREDPTRDAPAPEDNPQ